MASNELYTTTLIDNTYLKAYYRFESGALTTDSSGEGRTLTAISDPAEGTGKFGGGVDLDGNDAYSITDHADLKPTGAFTIGAWAKTSTTGASQAIFQSYATGGGAGGFIVSINTTNNIRIYAANLVSGGGGFNSPATYTDGNFHFVVVTHTGSGAFQMYADGSPVNSGTLYSPTYNATNYVRVGCGNDSGTNQSFFTGSLDDVFLFNGLALSADDISKIYAGTYPLKVSSTFFLFM